MKYIISALITDTVTLGNTNIDVTKTLTADQHLTLTGVGCNVSSTGEIDLTANSDLRITAFKVRPFLPGVVASVETAATVTLKFATISGGVAGIELLGATVRASKLDEWTPTNLFISKEALQQTYDGTGAMRPFTLFLTSGNVHVMDLNVQSDFEGRDVRFAIDLEIEADAILDASTGLAI